MHHNVKKRQHYANVYGMGHFIDLRLIKIAISLDEHAVGSDEACIAACDAYITKWHKL